MTKVTKGIIISLAGAILIGILAGVAVLLARNASLKKPPIPSGSSNISNITGNQSSFNASGIIDKKDMTSGRLSTFKSFSELVSTLKSKGYFDNNRSKGIMYGRNSLMEKSAATNEALPSMASADAASGAPSSTNIQVEGVDEGDTVKTDGKYIYILKGNSINIINPENSSDMKLVSQIMLDINSSNGNEMYIYKDKLVIIGNYYENTQKAEKEQYIPENHGTSIRVYSLTDIKKPSLFREFKVEGNISSSRLIDDKLYLVTGKGLYYIQEKDATPNNILPKYYDSASKTNDFVTIGEDRVNYCPESEMNSFLNIATLNINDTKEAKVETILGSAGTVYMTKENLYVAYPVYEQTENKSKNSTQYSNRTAIMIAPGSQNTVLLKFSVKELLVKYSASTKVSGSVLNQFSMDEYNGSFRIATTSSKEKSQNNVYIYDSSLNLTGKLEGLAAGERIYSVRYTGDTLYLVTFRQVDPLFVIDLSNPKEPKVLGELKIPGFSNYMHIVGENLVLGIGRDTKEQEYPVDVKPVPEIAVDGKAVQSSAGSRTIIKTGGIKISLFDVSDKKKPKELDNIIIGDNSANCEAQFNHKALIYNGKTGKLYLPFTFVSSDLKSRKMYTGAVISVSGNKLSEEHYFESPNVAGNYYYGSNGNRFCYIGSTLFQIDSGIITSYNINTYEKFGSLKF